MWKLSLYFDDIVLDEDLFLNGCDTTGASLITRGELMSTLAGFFIFIFLLTATSCGKALVDLEELANVEVVEKEFVSTWTVGDVSIGDGDLTITLPLRSGYNYNFVVDWGDGTSGNVSSDSDPEATHVYASPGTYTVKLSGVAEAFYFNCAGDYQKIQTVDNLGQLGWKSLERAFACTENLKVNLSGNASDLTTVNNIFENALNIEVDIKNWNTESLTLAERIFYLADGIELTVDSWIVSAGASFESAFFSAENFNIDVSAWEFGEGSDLSNFFRNVDNGVVTGPFDVKGAQNLSGMFDSARSISIDTTNWDTSSATDMSLMFYYVSWTPNTTSWDTSKVTTMLRTFAYSGGNPDVSNWDVSKVEDMTAMFTNTTSATPDTTNWVTTNLKLLDRTFTYAAAANPDTSGWDVSNVTTTKKMFQYATSANPDVSSWNTSSIVEMSNMFDGASSADPDMSSWDFSSIAILADIFKDIGLSTANYDSFLIRLDLTGPSSPPIPFAPHNGVNGGSSKYTSGGAAAAARSSLSAKGWNLSDGGVAP